MFGATRYGPVAPCACQFGKYDVRTSTGLPISETWNEIVSTSSWMSDTCVGTIGLLRRGAELLDVDVLPRLRSGRGPHLVELGRVHEPRRGRALPRSQLRDRRGRVGPRLAPALLVVARVHARDDRLLREPGDQRRLLAGILHLVDLPTVRRLTVEVGNRGDEVQVGLDGGHRLRLRREQHQVADAEHLQVLHAEREVGGARRGAVHETAHRVRRVLRELAHRHEVERGRGRRLEVQTFHRVDAPVREVRQQLERRASCRSCRRRCRPPRARARAAACPSSR